MSFALHNPLFRAPDRRFRVLWITPELLMDLVINPRAEGDVIRALTVQGIPDDAKIEGISYDFYRAAVGLRVWSASFDVVEDAGLPPDLSVTISEQRYRIDYRIADEAEPFVVEGMS